MKLKSKLIVGSILLAVLPVTISGSVITWLATQEAKVTLEEQAKNKLTAIREIKKEQIESYFQTIQDQALTFSNDRMIIEAMKDFTHAFRVYRREGQITERDVIDRKAQLAAYYTSDFGDEYARRNPGQQSNAREYVDQIDSDSIALQYQYIKANPHPLGSKDILISPNDGSTYSGLHQRYHPHLRHFLQRFGYYDIFLVDSESGDIVYSVFKELDYSTSLIDGPYAKTGIGKVFQAANAATNADTVILDDFSPYPPSYEDPASFIASPIFDGTEKVGVLIFQMPIDRINAIMTNEGRWSDVGLGLSGETYLVGPNFTLRNQSRFLLEDKPNYLQAIRDAGQSGHTTKLIDAKNTSIGLQVVRTIGTREALAGKTNFAIFPDYRNVPVLSAYAPLKIVGLNWVIMSEIDEAEAFEPVESLTNQIILSTLWIAGAMLIISVGLGWMFAVVTTRPIQSLQSTVDTISRDGNVQRRVEIQSKDEVGDLAHSYNMLLDRLQKVNGQMEGASEQVVTLASQVMDMVAPVEVSMREQVMQTTMVASSSDEMTATVQDVAENAQGAAELALAADCEAKRGGQVVSKTTEGMTRLSGLVDESATMLASLEQRSTHVGEVTNMINDIADQTNLLALNAAIEAARAGEQGRGFAVVADEVRKLAERTSKSTKEITDMIHSMQAETRETVTVMQVGKEEAHEALASAIESGDALGTILTVVDQVTHRMTQIATAAEEQSMTTKEISRNIESVAIVSRDNEGALSSISRGVFRLIGYATSVAWVAALEKGSLTTEPECSFARVALDPTFLDDFFTRFMKSDPSLRELFSRIDVEKQKPFTRTEIVALLMYARGNERGGPLLAQVVSRHRYLGLQPAMYDLWVKSLIATLKMFDPMWSGELDQCWRSTLAKGLDYIARQN